MEELTFHGANFIQWETGGRRGERHKLPFLLFNYHD
jgi:hypothetical protein